MKKEKEPIQGFLFPEMAQQSIIVPKKVTLKEKNQQLQTELREKDEQIQQMQKQIADLQKKATAFDELMSSKNLFPLGIIAKSFGRSAIWLNQYLKEKKVQYDQGEVWQLYAKYQDKGYTGVGWYEYGKDVRGRAKIRPHTYWTYKGMLFIKELLKEDGLIED